MLVEALPSIWASVHSWFTPAVFFVLLNVVIGTIAVTSARAHHHTSQDVDPTGPTQPRELDRVNGTSEPETKPETVQALPPPPPVEPEAKETHIIRSRSDTEPVAGEMLPKLSRKMKKSASAMSAFAHFDFSADADVADNKEDKKTATATETARVTEEEEDVIGEVDARADDFINKFRHQLKLQRMDSIIRYKETIKRAERKLIN